MISHQLSSKSDTITIDCSQKPIGSLDQFQLALYASKDARLTACDLAVLIEIIDRFLKRDGNTMPTGNAHLVRETGRSDGAVKVSRRRLVDFGYLTVEKPGSGSRGSAYIPNFDWSRSVAEVLRAEVAKRKKAKLARKSSGAANRPTNTVELVGQSTAPLKSLVWQPAAPLGGLVGRSATPQTYVDPTESLRRCAHTPTLGLTPASGVAPQIWEVVETRIDECDGEKSLVLEIQTDGETDEVSICVESVKASRQDSGQRILGKLSDAVGREIEDGSELKGMHIIIDDYGDVLPSLAPANANVTERIANG